ncbi:MAG TPA: FtsQ-type POTRA domain-containing protein [Kofleriaceae bacterium]|nr:FtsQ-type POTRA domain-containing protein [Kofleriaceae bacterium]
MDRSRRQGANGTRPATAPPASSRLTVRKHKNRRRPGSMWARLPRPAAIADACGRALRRSIAPAAAAVALGALGGGVWAGYHWICHSPRFAITRITVQGAHHVDPDQLRARLPLHVGDSVFANLDAAARVVRDDPWIAGAEVRRILPHTIAIEVHEHTPAAVVELGELYLADATGQPFKRVALEAGEGDGLPIITGIGRGVFVADPAAARDAVRDAIAAFDHWRAADRPPIGEIHVGPHGALTLHTYDRAIAIQLGAVPTGAAGSPPRPADPSSTSGTSGLSARSAAAGPAGPAGSSHPAGDTSLDARMRTFDAAWAGLSDAERARTRAIHIGPRPDHVTVAFAKD